MESPTYFLLLCIFLGEYFSLLRASWFHFKGWKYRIKSRIWKTTEHIQNEYINKFFFRLFPFFWVGPLFFIRLFLMLWYVQLFCVRLYVCAFFFVRLLSFFSWCYKSTFFRTAEQPARFIFWLFRFYVLLALVFECPPEKQFSVRLAFADQHFTWLIK